MLTVEPNVVKITFGGVEHDFTPVKSKLESDIAFDVKARLHGPSGRNIKSITIEPDAIGKIPLGFSLTMPPEFKVLTEDALMAIERYVEALTDYKTKIIRNMSVGNRPTMKDFIDDTSVQLFYPSSQLLGRSGLFFKSHLDAFIGQIDNAYDDELVIALHNIGDEPQVINFGERIGQLEIKLVPRVLMAPNIVASVAELNGHSRGGFGSSGR
jgi:hypothetical protein